jgi:HK97 family phage prohead protease
VTERLQVSGFVRQVDEESRRVTAVVSTSAVARDGAIIEVGGWRLDAYARNPVVLWAHDDRSLPIARTVRTWAEDGALMQEHEFADHPQAQAVFELVRGGFVNATSVRWIPGKVEWRQAKGADGKSRDVLVFVDGHELLEVSYVPVPADPGALVTRADGSPVELRELAPAPAGGDEGARRLLAIAGAIREMTSRRGR